MTFQAKWPVRISFSDNVADLQGIAERLRDHLQNLADVFDSSQEFMNQKKTYLQQRKEYYERRQTWFAEYQLSIRNQFIPNIPPQTQPSGHDSTPPRSESPENWMYSV